MIVMARLIRSDDSISSTRTSLIHFLEHSYHSTPLARMIVVLVSALREDPTMTTIH